jgi:hypothetical protein
MAKTETQFAASSKRPLAHLRHALDEAKARKTLVWLHIDAAWSPECAQWRESILNSPRVMRAREDAVFCEINRDDLPELDAAAQSLVQSLTRRGGWPLNVFLTPDGRPVFGVTTLDETSLLDCLRQLLVQFELNRAGLEEHAQKSFELARAHDPLVTNESAVAVPSEEEQSKLLSEDFYTTLLVPVIQSLNFESGLVGQGQVFQFPSVYRYLLDFTHKGQAAPFAVFEERSSAEFNAPNWGEVAYARLARSSLCDVLGGGFFRTARIDEFPHRVSTEKLLVENAEFFEGYAEASARTRSPYLLQVASETLRALVEDFYNEDKACWASFLSHAPETYLLSSADLFELLSGPERQPAQMFFGLGTQPSIPRIVAEIGALSKTIEMAPADLKNLLAEVQKKLRQHRASLGAEFRPKLGASSLHAEAVLVGSLLRGFMASSALAAMAPARAFTQIEAALDRWFALQPWQQGLAPREHWAVVRALLAYSKWMRVHEAPESSLARAQRALDTADLLMGLPENFPDNVSFDSVFMGLRFDAADHMGASAVSLRLEAWQDRADLSASLQTQSEAEALLLRRIQTHLSAQMAHSLGYAKILGLHGASTYLSLRRVLMPQERRASETLCALS